MKPDNTQTANLSDVPHPRGELSDNTRQTLATLVGKRDALEAQRAEAQAELRTAVVAALNEGSFRAVREATGLSTATLQKWKREAGN